MSIGWAILGFFNEVKQMSAAPEGGGVYTPSPSDPDAGQAGPVVPPPDGTATLPEPEVVIPAPIGGGGWVFDIPPQPPAGGEAEENRLPAPPVGGTAT